MNVNDIHLKIPPNVQEEKFRRGFEHSIRGGQLTKREHLQFSFREGFREGRLFIKSYCKAHGILQFPFKAKFKVSTK